MESIKEKVGNPPNFKGDGVAVWVNQDKTGKQYLSISLLGKNGIKVNAFKYDPTQKQTYFKGGDEIPL